jgi:WD40 repeat protein
VGGLFELQRELAVESARKKRTAKTKAKALAADPRTLIDEVWASDLDPKIVEPLYRKLAPKDEAIALTLARLDARSFESNRALFEENVTLVAPLLAARLKTDQAVFAAQLIGNLGPRAERALPALREAAKSGSDKSKQLWCAWAIARLGSEDDLAFAAKVVGPKPPPPMIAALARRGVPAFTALAIESVRSWLDARKTKSIDSDGARSVAEAIDALGEARSKDALDVLHEALDTPQAPAALGALASIAHPSSREPVERMLGLLAGDREKNWAHRLGGDDVLRAILPSAAWPPLDTAREVLEFAHPRRYGWPKVDDVGQLVTLAARALRMQGDTADVERVARLANAPLRTVRIEGSLAYAKVHGRPPALEYWDEPRTERALKTMKPSALLDIATRDTTVFRHNVVRALAKTKDAKVRTKLADFARAELESRPNHSVNYYEESDLGPDLHGFIDALETLGKDASIKKRLAKTTSLWIRHHILGAEIGPYEWSRGAPDPTPPLLPSVKKLGGRAQGSFAIGRHTNALAYSHDGTRLAAVGDSLGVIVDADTGETRVELELRYNWGYGAVFSNDDKRLYVAYHGGHVEVFDAETGKTLRSLEGHGGVPNGVRGIALSPDGKRLLTAGSDGRAFLWELPSGKIVRKWAVKAGTFYGTAFSADGERFALSQLKDDKAKKGDAVFVGDAKTGKATSFETPTSMWALAFAKNGTLVCAGEGKHIFFSNENGKPTRKLGQSDVVRVEFTGDDKTLVAISQNGEAKAWDIASGKAKKLPAGDGPLWALARNPKDGTIAMAGTAGVVHRFDASLQKIGGETALTMHTGQVRGFAILKSGRFFTCGWDGRLLVWDASGTRLVHQTEERMTDVALTADERHVLVLVGRKGLLCFDAQTLAITGQYLPKITNASTTNPESLAVNGDVAAVGHWGGFVRTFTIPTLEQRGEVSLGKPEIEALAPLADGFVCGTDDGRVVALSGALETLWTLAGNGRDLVDSDDRAASVSALAVHDKTIATGQSARLYDVSGATPVLEKRIVTHGGLFNNLAFSPSGARLFVPTSWSFEVYDTTIGTLLAKLDRKEFPGADQLTRAAPISEDEILVGAENGSIYQVTLR